MTPRTMALAQRSQPVDFNLYDRNPALALVLYLLVPVAAIVLAVTIWRKRRG